MRSSIGKMASRQKGPALFWRGGLWAVADQKEMADQSD